MYSQNDWRDFLDLDQKKKELYHHGIVGQKWGTRNGPPYPLSKEMSRAVQSSGYKERYLKDRDRARDIAAGKKAIGKFHNIGTAALISDHDQEWEEMYTTKGNQFLTDLLNSKTETSIDYQFNSSTGEKWASPTAVAREIVAKAKKNGFDDMQWNDNFLDGMYDAVSSGSINPGWKERAPGTTNNCAKGTFATELARRGMTGIAAGRQTYPSAANSMSYWFEGAHQIIHNSIDEYQSEIDGWGDHCSGELGVISKDGTFGHSIHFTKSSNDNFSIECGQSGGVWKANSFTECINKYTEDTGLGMWNLDNGWHGDITRLDNCEINWDAAEEDGCIRGDRVWNHNTKKVVSTW